MATPTNQPRKARPYWTARPPRSESARSKFLSFAASPEQAAIAAHEFDAAIADLDACRDLVILSIQGPPDKSAVALVLAEQRITSVNASLDRIRALVGDQLFVMNLCQQAEQLKGGFLQIRQRAVHGQACGDSVGIEKQGAAR